MKSEIEETMLNSSSGSNAADRVGERVDNNDHSVSFQFSFFNNPKSLNQLDVSKLMLC